MTRETLAVELELRRRGRRGHAHRGGGVGAGGGRRAPVGWRPDAPAPAVRGPALRAAARRRRDRPDDLRPAHAASRSAGTRCSTWSWSGPIALLGGFLGGIEHSGWEDGFVRGLLGGLVFGSFILLGHKIAGTEPEGRAPRPAGGARDPHDGGRRDPRRARAAASAPAARAPSPPRPRAAALRRAALAGSLAVTAPASVPHRDLSYDLGSPPPVAGQNRLDVYSPVGARRGSRPVVVWVHGGGWQEGDKRDGIRRKARLLTGAGYVLASVNYRLSEVAPPSGPFDPARIRFPDHPRDVGEAVAWLHRRVARFGGDPRRIVLMGHSSGAHVAALVATDPRYLRRYRVPRRGHPRRGVARHGGARRATAGQPRRQRGRARSLERLRDAGGERRDRRVGGGVTTAPRRPPRPAVPPGARRDREPGQGTPEPPDGARPRAGPAVGRACGARPSRHRAPGWA